MIIAKSQYIGWLGHWLHIPELVWLEEWNNIFKFLGLFVLLLGFLLRHNQLGCFLEVILAHGHLQKCLLLSCQFEHSCVLAEQFEEVLGLGVCNGDVRLGLVNLLLHASACGCGSTIFFT